MTNEQIEVHLVDCLFLPVWHDCHDVVDKDLFWSSTIEVELLLSEELLSSFEGGVEVGFFNPESSFLSHMDQ